MTCSRFSSVGLVEMQIAAVRAAWSLFASGVPFSSCFSACRTTHACAQVERAYHDMVRHTLLRGLGADA